MTLEQFFRLNYASMCNYCANNGFIFADVEEAVSDVIMKHYYEYRTKLSATVSSTALDSQVKRWLNRRAMLNVKSRYTAYTWPQFGELKSHDVVTLMHQDDPESLLDLKQRLPSKIPQILIDYEQYGGSLNEKGCNVANDRVKFCRAKKSFLAELRK